MNIPRPLTSHTLLFSFFVHNQIRRYKANADVMEKAAEVYKCLKSRVLGSKPGANQKVNKTDLEKDKGEGERGKEKSPEEETQNERDEDERNAGKGPAEKILPCPRRGLWVTLVV